MNTIIKTTPNGESPFDSIRHLDENGQEYWLARELMKILGYTKWQRFEDAIERATISCEVAGDSKAAHFNHLPGSVKTSALGGRPGDDYKLSRRACYLVAVNGDIRKTEIADAQKYFLAKARKAEIAEAEAEAITADSFTSLTSSGQLMAIRNALASPGSISEEQMSILTEGLTPMVVTKIGALTNEQYLKLYLTLRLSRVPQDIQDQKDAGLFNESELKIADKTIERFDWLQKGADRKWQQTISGGSNKKILKRAS